MNIYQKKDSASCCRGYTLIEMLIVISIMGILATIAMPNFMVFRIRASEATLRQDLFVFRDVIDKYYGDHGKFPDTLENLVDEKYIREIPKDPFTGSATTWIIMPPAEGEPGNVYDVHSGSYKVGLNGVPYNEW